MQLAFGWAFIGFMIVSYLVCAVKTIRAWSNRQLVPDDRTGLGAFMGPFMVAVTIAMPALVLVFAHKVWSDGSVLLWNNGNPEITSLAGAQCETAGGQWIGNVLRYPLGQEPRTFALYCKMPDGSLTRYLQQGRRIVSITTHADPQKDDL